MSKFVIRKSVNPQFVVGFDIKQIVLTIETFVHTHVHFLFGRKDPFVSVEELAQLRTNVQSLRLALHGTTPERESAREKTYQLVDQPVPDLILPVANVALWAEFNGLVRWLDHVGFPHVESVRLKTSEFEFVNAWISDLSDRLSQLQKDSRKTRVALENNLTIADLLLQSFCSRYPTVESNSDYHRLTGVLRVLKVLFKSHTCDQHLSPYTKALIRDLNDLDHDLLRDLNALNHELGC
jgi:hypothetical protein